MIYFWLKFLLEIYVGVNFLFFVQTKLSFGLTIFYFEILIMIVLTSLIVYIGNKVSN